MNFVKIRLSLHKLSQHELGILFSTSPANIRNWEQGIRRPDSTTLTLYHLAEDEDPDVLYALIKVACKKTYSDIKDIRALQRAINKLITGKLAKGLLEVMIISNNVKWTAKELGYKATHVTVPQISVKKSNCD